MISNWFPLPDQDGSRYIIKHRFEPAGYAIFISDACRIWSEKLSFAQVVQRARSLDCSITPSDDDPNQLSILFKNLEYAFRGNAGAQIRLDDSNIGEQISVTTNTPLPIPLPPLTWLFELKLGPAGVMREELVVPLLSLSYSQTERIEQLSTELHEKDNAMSKLLDKLQSKNIELKNLFPSVPIARTSKKDISRTDIEHYFKAYRVFEESKWLEAMNTEQVVEYHELVLGAFKFMSSINIKVHGLSDEDRDGLQKRNLLRAHSTTDKFETRSTPPLRGGLQAFEPSIISSHDLPISGYPDAEDTTDDSDDLDTLPRPSKRFSTPKRFHSSSSFVRDRNFNRSPAEVHECDMPRSQRLERALAPEIEKAMQYPSPSSSPFKRGANEISTSLSTVRQSTPPSPSPPRKRATAVWSRDPSEVLVSATSTSQSTPRKLDRCGGEQSVFSSSPPISSKKSAPRELSEVAVTPRKRLGRIGGRSASQTSQSSSQLPSSSPTRATQTQTQKRPMTRIDEEEEAIKAIKEEDMGTMPAVVASSPAPTSETPQDRADRKREELRRELVEKGRAGTKKKRRF